MEALKCAYGSDSDDDAPNPRNEEQVVQEPKAPISFASLPAPLTLLSIPAQDKPRKKKKHRKRKREDDDDVRPSSLFASLPAPSRKHASLPGLSTSQSISVSSSSSQAPLSSALTSLGIPTVVAAPSAAGDQSSHQEAKQQLPSPKRVKPHHDGEEENDEVSGALLSSRSDNGVANEREPIVGMEELEETTVAVVPQYDSDEEQDSNNTVSSSFASGSVVSSKHKRAALTLRRFPPATSAVTVTSHAPPAAPQHLTGISTVGPSPPLASVLPPPPGILTAAMRGTGVSASGNAVSVGPAAPRLFHPSDIYRVDYAASVHSATDVATPDNSYVSSFEQTQSALHYPSIQHHSSPHSLQPPTSETNSKSLPFPLDQMPQDPSFARELLQGKAKVIDVRFDDLTQRSLKDELAARYDETGKIPEAAVKAHFWDATKADVTTTFKPDKIHKRKHQINQVAFVAQQNELEIAKKRAQGLRTKRDTMAKYGW